MLQEGWKANDVGKLDGCGRYKVAGWRLGGGVAGGWEDAQRCAGSNQVGWSCLTGLSMGLAEASTGWRLHLKVAGMEVNTSSSLVCFSVH